MPLRDYQVALKQEIYQSWQDGKRNVLAVAPTGAGKTEIKASIFSEYTRPSCAIAHRQELTGQISNAMAKYGVHHRIIAPKAVIKFCITQHVRLYGRSYHHAQAPAAVAGIDTLLKRADDHLQWRNSVGLWDIDEAHHVLSNNKWGKGVDLFPHAWGVGFTASPIRCDRRSLARSQSGVFDALVVGPSMRELINRGYLADYRIFGPPASIDTRGIRVSEATGDYNQDELRKAAHKSRIVGDIVEHYLRVAPGARGITFTVDVEQAGETAAAFRQKGVPAEAISAKTPDTVRVALIEKFRQGDLKQLVNVDLFGEGYDCPAVEVVSMGRPTQSFGLYIQQFGRCMRISEGKTHGTVIDHVENVKRHRLPDAPRNWTLESEERGRRQKSDIGEIPLTFCVACYQPFEAVTKICPWCGHVQEPAGRSLPEQVDGDLIEYGPELLERLGREAVAATATWGRPIGTPVDAVMAKNMALRAEAQHELRDCIALWAGIGRDVHGYSDSEMYRRFYWTFGIDVATAKTLGRPEAVKLTNLIRETMT